METVLVGDISGQVLIFIISGTLRRVFEMMWVSAVSLDPNSQSNRHFLKIDQSEVDLRLGPDSNFKTCLRFNISVHRQREIEFRQVITTEMTIEQTFQTFNFSFFATRFKNIQLIQKSDKFLAIFPIFDCFTWRT